MAANGANKRLVLHLRLRCGSLFITTPVSLLPNAFDVFCVLHRQVRLVAVNQICVLHEAMNVCKKIKDSLKDCFENVNTIQYGCHGGHLTILHTTQEPCVCLKGHLVGDWDNMNNQNRILENSTKIQDSRNDSHLLPNHF